MSTSKYIYKYILLAPLIILAIFFCLKLTDRSCLLRVAGIEIQHAPDAVPAPLPVRNLRRAARAQNLPPLPRAYRRPYFRLCLKVECPVCPTPTRAFARQICSREGAYPERINSKHPIKIYSHEILNS